MNNIPTAQNRPEQLDLLAAQRRLYSNAKRVFLFHAMSAGPVAIGLSLASMASSVVRPWSVLWGILVSLADLIWLSPMQERMRSTAAAIQEQFDCEVLELRCNKVKPAGAPSQEVVARHAAAYRRHDKGMPPLEDWYPKSVGTIPLHMARLVCQRANCWWDAEQRRRYTWVLGVAIAAIVIGLTCFGMARGLSIEQLLMSVFAPLSPLVFLGIRQVRDHRRAAERLDHLRSSCESAWAEMRGRNWTQKAETVSRAVQDEIFECRRRNPPVLDSVFRRLRRDMEAEMSYGANKLVEEARLGAPDPE